jgi:hypothetical protein
MDVHDFDLRFDDRVLAVHAFVNTDREPSPIAKEMQRAAKGPRLDASSSWIEGYNDGRAVWAEMIRERDLKNPPTLQHGSRVLVFHLFVNTDADAYHIHKAILRIARGPRLDATVCWIELYEGEDGRKVWSEIQKMSTKIAADPRSTSYSIVDDG